MKGIRPAKTSASKPPETVVNVSGWSTSQSIMWIYTVTACPVTMLRIRVSE